MPAFGDHLLDNPKRYADLPSQSHEGNSPPADVGSLGGNLPTGQLLGFLNGQQLHSLASYSLMYSGELLMSVIAW